MKANIKAAVVCGVLLGGAFVPMVHAKDLKSIEVLLPFNLGWGLSPLVVAQDQGFFEEKGLDVKFNVADGSGFVSLQAIAGNVDFAVMSALDSVIAYEKKNDLRVLMCNQVNNSYRIVATKASGITSVAELKGRTLGMTEAGGGEMRYVDAALAEAGIDRQELTLLPIGGAGPQSLSALQGGVVDAYSSSFGDVASLGAGGIEWVDITPPTYDAVPANCLVVTEGLIASQDGADTVTALMDGWVKGIEFLRDNEQETYDTVCETLPALCQNPAVAEAYYAQARRVVLPNDAEAVPGKVNPQAWEAVREILSAANTVDKALDLKPFAQSDAVLAVQDRVFANR